MKILADAAVADPPPQKRDHSLLEAQDEAKKANLTLLGDITGKFVSVYKTQAVNTFCAHAVDESGTKDRSRAQRLGSGSAP